MNQRRNTVVLPILSLWASLCLASNPVDPSDYYQVGKFRYIKDNLYQKEDDLYFLTERIVELDDGNIRRLLIYRKRFSYPDKDKVQLDKKLSEVVDSKSWRQVSGLFFRDKRSLYCFQPTSDGGYLIFMDGFDPDEQLFFVNDGWHKPGNYQKINEPKVFGPMVSKYGVIGWYSTDGHDVYYRCNKLEAADVDSFYVVEDQEVEWTARDKNNFYKGSRTIINK